MNNICVFCLSHDRNLTLIKENQWHTLNIFLDVDSGIKNLYDDNALKICWECRGRINNFSSFTKCAQQSCISLMHYLSQAVLENKNFPHSLSKMGMTEVETINVISQQDMVPTVDCVSFVNEKITSKVSVEPINFIKIEDNKFGIDLLDSASTSNVKLEKKMVKSNSKRDHKIILSSSDSDDDNIDNEHLENNDTGDMKSEDKWIKNESKMGSNDDVIESSLDSDDEPLTKSISTAPKKKLKAKKAKPAARTVKSKEKPGKRLPRNCTVSWATNTQAKEWYQEECKADKEAHPSYKLPCDLCQRVFADEETLEAHNQQYHSEQAGQFSCDLCSHRFIDTSLLNQHLESHYMKYNCNLCSYETRNQIDMQTHTKEIHDKKTDKTIKCRRCKNDINSGDIKKHRKECQNEYQCEQCEMSFGNLKLYVKHKTSHKNENSNEYTYCEGCKSYIKNTWYKKHFLTSLKHVSRDTFKYSCSECSVKLPTAYTLKLHMFNVHLKRGSHECDLCPAYYMNRKRLDKHRALKHQLGTWEVKKDKICDVCGKGFTANHLLDNHRRSHTGERPYQCEFCPSTFTQQGSLYHHTLTVHRKRIHKNGHTDADKSALKVCCDACGKQFRNKFVLKAHYDYNHLQKTEYRCEGCDKYFATSATLKDHNECRHGIVAPRKSCPTCGKLFKTTYSLNAHLRSNCVSTDNPQLPSSGDKFYKCRACDSSFKRATTLYMHYKMRHLKLKRNDKVSIKNLFNTDKEIVVIKSNCELTTPEEKYYKCRSCDSSFMRAPTLYMHYKLKHLKLKTKDRVTIKNLFSTDKEIVVIRDPGK